MKPHAVCLSLVLAAAGCADSPPNLSIECFPVIDAEKCTVPAVCDLHQNGGVFDIAAFDYTPGFGYVAGISVKNLLVQTTQMGAIRGSDIYLTGFDVRLTPGAGNTSAPPVIRDVTGHIDVATIRLEPNGGTTGASGVLLPASLLAQAAPNPGGGWNGEVIAHVAPVGTRAGSIVRGPEAMFPIQVCVGCLIAPGCDTTLDTVCNPGQDVPQQCCANDHVCRMLK